MPSGSSGCAGVGAAGGAGAVVTGGFGAVTTGRVGRFGSAVGLGTTSALAVGAVVAVGAAVLGVTVTLGATGGAASLTATLATGIALDAGVGARWLDTYAAAEAAEIIAIAPAKSIRRDRLGGATGESFVALTPRWIDDAGAVAENAVRSLSSRGPAMATGADAREDP